MQTNPLMRKGLSIGIILLFIGVSIVPSINFNIVNASKDNDLVEVTTQACGIKGFGTMTVTLTQEQYHHLQQYLAEFQTQVNHTTTWDEAFPLFDKAVIELNTYGLLPRGMSVVQAQKLVTGSYQKISGRIHHFIEKNHQSLRTNENFCCLLVGSLTHTLSHGSINNMCNRIIWLLYSWYQRHPTAFMEGILNLLLMGFIFDTYASMIFSFIIPLHLFATIGVGYILFARFEPADGTLYTIGLNGIKKWSGELAGNLPLVSRVAFPYEDYPGIFGFTGLAFSQFFTNNDTTFYLGSALWVNITSDYLHV